MAKRTYNLTNLDNSVFSYEVTDDAGKSVEVVLDLDSVYLAFNRVVPTLFKPCGENNQDGSEKNGWTKFFELLDSGVQAGDPQWPVDIPTPEHVEAAIRTALRVPTFCVPSTSWKILSDVFFAEVKRKNDLKKNSPPSPDSSTNTPA